MTKIYTLPDGTKFIFEYNHNRVGTITLECMDILMSLLKATAKQDEPQTDMAEDIVRSYGFKAESYRQAKAKTEPQSLEQFRVGLEYHTDSTHFGKVKGESIATNNVGDEPQSDARKFLGYVCETCKHRDEEWDSEACDGCCENDDHYEPQTDIGTSDTVYSDTAGYVPRVDMTDCSWK